MPGTQKKQAVRLPMRLFVAVAVVVIAAVPAVAQTANAVIADLRKGVPCAPATARPAMEANITKVAATVADIDAALAAINADTSICNALRDAAKEIASARASGPATATSAAASAALPAPGLTGDMPASSRDAVAAALAEGERRAASLKFEVGPPPPNLTKGRNSGS